MKKADLVSGGGPTGGKSPQGLGLQRKRRGKKNFSGPGKRFLSQGAGNAAPAEPAGLRRAVRAVAGGGVGRRAKKGRGPGPLPHHFSSWASVRLRQPWCGGRRSDGTPVRRTCAEGAVARHGPSAGGGRANPPRGHGRGRGHRPGACLRGGGRRACGRSGGRRGDRRAGQSGRPHGVRDGGPDGGPVFPGPRAGRHGGPGGRCRCGGRGRCRHGRSVRRRAGPCGCLPAGQGSSGAFLRRPQQRAGPAAGRRSCGRGGACRAVPCPPGPGP